MLSDDWLGDVVEKRRTDVDKVVRLDARAFRRRHLSPRDAIIAADLGLKVR